MAWIEHATSPLPRECSTTELHGQNPPALKSSCNSSILTLGLHSFGAGEGNRTLVVSLEGFCSAIELHPRSASLHPAEYMVEGEGFEPSKAEPSDLQSDPFDRS